MTEKSSPSSHDELLQFQLVWKIRLILYHRTVVMSVEKLIKFFFPYEMCEIRSMWFSIFFLHKLLSSTWCDSAAVKKYLRFFAALQLIENIQFLLNFLLPLSFFLFCLFTIFFIIEFFSPTIILVERRVLCMFELSLLQENMQAAMSVSCENFDKIWSWSQIWMLLQKKRITVNRVESARIFFFWISSTSRQIFEVSPVHVELAMLW